ncbi:MAG TPA: hypothetical protein VIK18_00130 [Pirellulales bacterium]
MVNGVQFSSQDFATSLDVWKSDGDSRPRVLSAFADIVTTKSRLALWDYVLPHPTFTPLWALTVLLGTILLYKFMYIVTEDRQAALAGAAVYLVSPGLLSGATMLFHSGKPLANLIVITAFWISAKLDRAGVDGGLNLFKAKRYYAGLFALLFLAPFADETAAFAYFAPTLWCSSMFWPTRSKSRVWLANWLAILLPAIASVVVMLWVLPLLTMSTLGKEFNLPNYFQQITDTKRFGFAYLLWTGYNLLAAFTFPGAFDRVDVPVRWRGAGGNHIDLSVASVVICAIMIAGATWIMRRQKLATRFYKLELITGIFVLFQATVLLCHPLLLVAPGFYYGAIFSILFASLAAMLYAGLRTRGTRLANFAAMALILFVGGVSLRNFMPLNTSWMRHENYLGLWKMRDMQFFRKQGDWEPLKKLVPPQTAYYGDDADWAAGDSPLAETRKIWRRWRRGEPKILEGTVHVRDFWVAHELILKTTLSAESTASNRRSDLR